MAPAVSVDLEPSKSTVNGTRPDPPSEPSTAWGSLCTPGLTETLAVPVLASPWESVTSSLAAKTPARRRCDLLQPGGIRLPSNRASRPRS